MAELHCRPGSVLCFPVTLSLQEFKCYIIKFALIPQNMDGLWKEKNSSLRQCGCSTYAGVGNIPDNKEMGNNYCFPWILTCSILRPWLDCRRNMQGQALSYSHERWYNSVLVRSRVKLRQRGRLKEQLWRRRQRTEWYSAISLPTYEIVNSQLLYMVIKLKYGRRFSGLCVTKGFNVNNTCDPPELLTSFTVGT